MAKKKSAKPGAQLTTHTTTPVAKQTKPGRPPGSPNKDYPAVEEIPAACVKCRSPNLVKVEGSKVIGPRPISGTLRNGFQYSSVSHTRKRCSDCGQLQIVRSYFGSPAAAPSAEN